MYSVRLAVLCPEVMQVSSEVGLQSTRVPVFHGKKKKPYISTRRVLVEAFNRIGNCEGCFLCHSLSNNARFSLKCFNVCSGEFCLHASQQTNNGSGGKPGLQEERYRASGAIREDATKRISPLLIVRPLGSRRCTTFKEISRLRCY